MSELLTEAVFSVVQALCMMALAPLVIGCIRKVKAYFQSRQGASVFQPYFDLAKLLRKGSSVSKDTSWVFHYAPYICFAAILMSALLVPFFVTSTLGVVGDLIVVVYLMAAMRFFMALAALDTASTFAGMGSSREMMISAIVEPTMLLAIFTMALLTGTTVLSDISFDLASTGLDLVHPGLFLAAAAFFICLLAENARIPFDNPATHLELTMVHEAMVLEYSGRQLAVMELASWTKLVLFATLLANVFFPWGIAIELTPGALILGVLVILIKLGIIALAIAIIESSTAKLRLFRLPNLLTVAFTLALLAVTSYYIL